MSRFRNDTGGVLTIADLCQSAGPGGEIDWPDHDPEVHGLPTGFTWLDRPEPEAETPAGGAESDADGSGDPPPGDDAKTARRRGKAGQETSE